MLGQPKVLADKGRLQEIYDLRVLAYEHSEFAEYVNRQRFPTGWKDELDESENSVHWVIESNHKIVAAARLAILSDWESTRQSTNGFAIPSDRPFAFWSRLVVHPDHRHLNAASSLDRIRIQFIQKRTDIAFAVCWANPNRIEALKRLGFVRLGECPYKWIEAGGGGPATRPVSAQSMFVLIPER